MSARSLGGLGGIVAVLAVVEFTSGILQGYYTPMLTDIARHLSITDADVNWLEGSQLMFSALVVPTLAKLGDLVGHKRILLVSTAITGLASFALAMTDSFPVFLVAWALQGAYAVWLPLEIALIWSRASVQDGVVEPARITRRAAGTLVAALETGAIAGALLGGALVDVLPLGTVLALPAITVTLCFVAIGIGVREAPVRAADTFDTVGVVLVSLALVGFTGGLSLLRLQGPTAPLPWLVVVAGLALLVPFARWELRQASPLIDVRMFRDPALWPVFLTAGLFGVSVLGAQAPLSTFARTDPATVGYGLGTAGFTTSLLIGAYVLSLAVGAMLLPLATRFVAPRIALFGACLLVAGGYLLLVPFHDTYGQVLTCMVVAGIGSGALVAALPAAAAAAAPPEQTGVATGLTNSVKTVGGAIASCVFGLALLHGAGGTAVGTATTAGTLTGYYTVWIVCGGTALVAATCLLFVPKHAFTDPAAPAALPTV
ncbi:MFS transporter [Pseudoclavibacter chungangensis]|uniref:MFS transporter n=1 Tax=Pseudoclavibacter chungangensis TaxID=587635 RepID=A0A7J5C2A3_9MICO|nr:MFS transporter [Pseudoclavibacter chungangensis]KAB1662603.1 MFS transporter [Pseudoclavibacter chungangensis]NYJ68652.1 MFS family permease [Pseudoclavibacter chungangensis]